MSSLWRGPEVYVPPGVSAPAWMPRSRPGCEPTAARSRWPEDLGCELIEAEPGGMFYPLGRQTLTPGWTRSAAGWWIRLGELKPQALARVERHPRVVSWAVIEGVVPEHQWAVPVLVRWREQEGGQGLWVAALDRIWGGGDRWSMGSEIEYQVQLLLGLVHDEGRLDIEDGDVVEELVELAVALLQHGQHVDADLLILAGWLSELMVVRVLRAAIGWEGEVRV